MDCLEPPSNFHVVPTTPHYHTLDPAQLAQVHSMLSSVTDSMIHERKERTQTFSERVPVAQCRIHSHNANAELTLRG